jgi:polyhydroxyalkanoate synthesis regulator phasin
MLDLMKKAMLIGLGLTSMTRDKVEQFAKEISEDSKLSEEEGKKLVEEMVRQSDEARANMEKEVRGLVKKTMEKLNIPSRTEMRDLADRIEALEDLHKGG